MMVCQTLAGGLAGSCRIGSRGGGERQRRVAVGTGAAASALTQVRDDLVPSLQAVITQVDKFQLPGFFDHREHLLRIGQAREFCNNAAVTGNLELVFTDTQSVGAVF